jgi:hypothetical protein
MGRTNMLLRDRMKISDLFRLAFDLLSIISHGSNLYQISSVNGGTFWRRISSTKV